MNRVIMKIQDIHKSFNSNKVLIGIDLEVEKGETVCIIGPSGVGKTTLLKCLNLLELIDQGSIYVKDKKIIEAKTNGTEHQNSMPACIFKGNNREEIERKIFVREDEFRKIVGMVFQQFNLWPSKTVFENIIEAPIYVKRIKKEEAGEIALRLCKEVGLEDKMSSYPIELSGGQQQRAAIARALAMEPEILLLDEVTSALDPELVVEVLRVIKRLKDKEITLLVVTHHIEFAQEIADRIILLHSGSIIEQGPPQEILQNPKDRRTRSFLGTILEAR